MARFFVGFTSLVLVLLCWRPVLHAQKFPVSYLDISHGLSNNSVMNIYQDGDGYMWFGTYDGLNRYDGYEFKIFRNIIGDTSSILGNNIYTIMGDAARNIWVGGQNGASVYQQASASFSPLRYLEAGANKPLPLKDIIHQIRTADGETMLVGSQNLGLLVCKNNTRVAQQVPFTNNGQKTYSYDVTAIEQRPGQPFCWVFIRQSGLFTFDLATKLLRPFNTQLRQVNCITTGDDGNLWLGTDDGLYSCNSVSGVLSASFLPIKTKVTSVLADKQGNLWIGTDGAGILYLPKNAGQAVAYGSGPAAPLVKSNAVWALYEDRDGRKWVGTLRGGVSMMDAMPRYFTHIKDGGAGLGGAAGNFILSFCEEPDGNVLIGTDGAGLRYWDRKTNALSTIAAVNGPKHISSNFITSIIHDTEGDTWLSTWYGGINRIRKSSGGVENFNCYNPVTRLAEPNIWLVYEDSRKNIWASATNQGCLYSFNRNSSTFELFDTAIADVQCISETRDGKLWAGNYLQLMEIDVPKKSYRKFSIGYPVRCLLEVSDSQLWVGTQEGGLLLFNRKTSAYKRYTVQDGLPSNTILSLLKDREGNLWMSTYNGLSKFNPSKATFQNYAQSDGLQSNQFSYNAGLALSSGEFLFGGINGFNIFMPHAVRRDTLMPALHITGIKTGNLLLQDHPGYMASQTGPGTTQITVPFDEAAVTIDFAALEFSVPDKINYAYYLEGWDNGWNYTGHNRSAIYTHLNEGSYTLRIKSTNAAGAWNPKETMLKIVVLPPWYRSWWAYTLYAGLLGFVAFIYFRYRKKQSQLQYQVRIAHIEKEKEKELNENKLNFFTNVSHEFRTPLTLIINPLKDILYKKNNASEPPDLNVVYRNAKRLLSLVDQLLLFRKADSDADRLRVGKINFNDLCYEVYLCFVQQAKSKNLRYNFANDGVMQQEEDFYCDREKIEIAVFNLIANAIKYTPDNGSIAVTVSNDGGTARVLVADSGPGIGQAEKEKLYNRFFQASDLGTKPGFGIGLYVSQKFANLHHGSIVCDSELGMGAVFTLSIPKGKAHFDDKVIFEDSSGGSTFLQELVAEVAETTATVVDNGAGATDSRPAPLAKTAAPGPDMVLADVAGDTPVMLVVDDNMEIRQYISQIFSAGFTLHEAADGAVALELARTQMPDIIISDVVMQGGSGIELCMQLKADEGLRHIPIILLSASSSADIKLKGIELGADDYITKPFDKDLLVARVNNLLEKRNSLQQYFFNEVTLQQNPLKISEEYKQFLDRCIAIVEKNIDNDDFNVKALVAEIGLSQSNLYRKVKAISGQSISAFIRFIRLRKAASLLVNTQCNVNEAAFQAGISDVKYFRKQFQKLFGMTPTDYIKKYRKPFQKQYSLNEKAVR